MACYLWSWLMWQVFTSDNLAFVKNNTHIYIYIHTVFTIVYSYIQKALHSSQGYVRMYLNILSIISRFRGIKKKRYWIQYHQSQKVSSSSSSSFRKRYSLTEIIAQYCQKYIQSHQNLEWSSRLYYFDLSTFQAQHLAYYGNRLK